MVEPTRAPMQLGLLLRNGEQTPGGKVIGWAEIRETARIGEAVGFDTIWVDDHFIFRKSERIQMAEGESRGLWECFMLLAALAEWTSRVTIGPLVACTSFRNPAHLAKMADTIDEISGGRLILGLGAGWNQPEYHAFGYPFDHRASRFEEALKIIIPLLRQGHVDFEGTYYQARDCELRPRGPRPNGPPIWLTGRQPRMQRLIARYSDGLNAVWHNAPEPVIARFAAFDDLCREVGRDPRDVLHTSGAFVHLAGTDQPVPDPIPPTTIVGTAEEIAERLHDFAAAGVEHFTLLPDPCSPAIVERLGRAVEFFKQRQARAAGPTVSDRPGR